MREASRLGAVRAGTLWYIMMDQLKLVYCRILGSKNEDPSPRVFSRQREEAVRERYARRTDCC